MHAYIAKRCLLFIPTLLLATLHAVVLLDGSSEEVVHPDAAEEALEYLAGYLQRLEGPDLQRIREDMETLLGHARQEKWPREEQEFLQSFLADFGIGGEDEA